MGQNAEKTSHPELTNFPALSLTSLTLPVWKSSPCSSSFLLSAQIRMNLRGLGSALMSSGRSGMWTSLSFGARRGKKTSELHDIAKINPLRPTTYEKEFLT